MAGSYSHIVDEQGRFIGTRLIENLGDAYEALEECYGMIWLLAGGEVSLVEDAHARYAEGLLMSPGSVDE